MVSTKNKIQSGFRILLLGALLAIIAGFANTQGLAQARATACNLTTLSANEAYQRHGVTNYTLKKSATTCGLTALNAAEAYRRHGVSNYIAMQSTVGKAVVDRDRTTLSPAEAYQRHGVSNYILGQSATTR